MAYVPPAYPTAIPDYTDLREVVDDVDDIIASDHNDLMKELIAIQTELGTVPKGSYATVKDRLDYMQPAYNDRGDPAARDFTAFTTDGNWYDLDLSSIVPVGTKAVNCICVIGDNLVNQIFTFRKKGNSNDIAVATCRTQIANQNIDFNFVVACDTDRVIQYRASNTAWTTNLLTIIGWWK